MLIETDIAIIGGGSSAFSAAIEASDRGAQVVLVNQGTIGGTCVNVGCVPSKIQVRAGEIAWHRHHTEFDGFEAHKVLESSFHMARHRHQQHARVEALRNAKYLDVIKENTRVRLISGKAIVRDAHHLKVSETEPKRDVLISFRVLIVATGSFSRIPEIPGLSAPMPFWDSTSALMSDRLPKHLIVIGGSYIALELGQSFHRLGSQVTVLARSTLLSAEDPLVGTYLQSVLTKQGITVHLHCGFERVDYDGDRFSVVTHGGTVVDGDQLLVAAGRVPQTSDLSLESLGVKMASDGSIEVNQNLQTSVPNVYAVGDCASIPKYVYVAAASGTRAARHALLRYPLKREETCASHCEPIKEADVTLDLSVVPAVVFTDPQVGTVGLTEDAARREGIDVETRTLFFNHLPRALVNFDEDGFLKLVAERGTGKLLGAAIVSPAAGEVVQTIAIAIRAKMTTKQLADQLFPYLTYVEAVKLCAQMFFKDVSKLSCCAG